MQGVMDETIPGAERLATRAAPRRTERALTVAQHVLLRYGLVAMLLWFGAFKFHPAEVAAIQPLLTNSPLLAWLPALLGAQGASIFIGVTELVTAALLLARRWSPRLALAGSVLAGLTFLVTLSFLVTTPGGFIRVPGFPLPLPGEAGSFIVKDVFLLGAAVWCAAEALAALRSSQTERRREP
ncbi:DUF417 family protein [Pyxidicoccus sp. 3LG]